MTLSTKTTLAFLLMTATATAEERLMRGAVDAETYGESTVYELVDITLETNTNSLVTPHQVRVHDSPARELVQCSLFDSAGNAVDHSHTNSGSGGQLLLFFNERVPDATARCFFTEIERLTRPSTGGVVVNRLSAPSS